MNSLYYKESLNEIEGKEMEKQILELKKDAEAVIRGKASAEEVKLLKEVIRKGIKYIERLLEKIKRNDKITQKVYHIAVDYAFEMGEIYRGRSILIADTVINPKRGKTGLENEELAHLAGKAMMDFIYSFNYKNYVSNSLRVRKECIKRTETFVEKTKASLELIEKTKTKEEI